VVVRASATRRILSAAEVSSAGAGMSAGTTRAAFDLPTGAGCQGGAGGGRRGCNGRRGWLRPLGHCPMATTLQVSAVMEAFAGSVNVLAVVVGL